MAFIVPVVAALAGAVGGASTLSLIGSGIGAVGSVIGGIQASNAANFNAKVAKQNAQLANNQAADEATAQQRQSYKVLGAARAGYGAAGVTLEGSPLAVLEESASQAELDKQTILYKGRIRAMGYNAEAAADRQAASSAMIGGIAQGASGLLTGIGNYANANDIGGGTVDTVPYKLS